MEIDRHVNAAARYILKWITIAAVVMRLDAIVIYSPKNQYYVADPQQKNLDRPIAYYINL